MKDYKVKRQPNHIVTMINFNWNCIECGYENSASLSEEEDLAQTNETIITCINCRFNNRIPLTQIYYKHDH